jgi:uncharacterized membrane protein
MNERRVRAASQAAIAIWLALIVSVLCWPLGVSAIGWVTTSIAFLPLLLPLPGLARGTRRTQGWAPLTLALAEVLVNPAQRLRIAVTLLLILTAFAAILAALRAAPRA